MPEYLGQHFLKNQAAIAKIVTALDLREGDTVIEIGPGRGALTAELLKKPIKLIGIEKDSVLVDRLRREFQISNFKFQIVEGDILKVLPKIKIRNLKFKIVGNIPYYLTGFLFRIISELENKPSLIVFTIQKEVAERIIAQPPKMNLLAASVQIWAEPEILMILPPEDFDPPPKIDSAIIRLRIGNKELGIRELGNYYKLIKIIFKQPRKTILNNLSVSNTHSSKGEVKQKLQNIDLTGEERGQDLSIEKLIELSIVFPIIPNS
ncbi:MAG: 16S rRNA (adenine(1518)-N(6)/adenine(1519)-N(6))-dimethyltransferase RsmA [Patescibacteria group bacterium]